MAAELFNSLAGYSVGIPPVPVADANGNIVTNVLTNGNVSANSIYATYYRWANGQPFAGAAAGQNQQLQYNYNGAFAGIPNVTYDGSTLSLGDISALNIGGGIDGYFLQTDGEGNLTWSAAGGGGGNGSPGGSNTQVQFNNAGTFGGDSGFTYNNITNTLSVQNANVDVLNTGHANLGPIGNITITGGFANYVLTTDGTGNLRWSASAGGGGNPAGSNSQVQFNANGSFGATANFTFDNPSNTLNVTNANVSNVLRVLGDIQCSEDITASNVTLSRNVTTSNAIINGNLLINPTANLRAYGNVNTSGSANINLGTLSNIHIAGGSDGYVLQTDGLGNLSWTAQSGGGGNGSPGGSNTQIQFNNSGIFGASPYFTFNSGTNTLNVAGNLIANTITIGSGAYQFSTSNVYFATSATTSQTTLLSFPANSISGLDFVIIATDATAGNRQISKMTAVFYDSTVNYTEFNNINVNGPVGDFIVSYVPGNIITPPQAVLSVMPQTSHMSVYKIQITAYQS
jgi:hypothetical protein